MKVSQLVLAGALVAALSCSLLAQGPGPGMYPGGQPGGGYPQGGAYQGMPQGGGYPMMAQGGPMMQQGGPMMQGGPGPQQMPAYPGITPGMGYAGQSPSGYPNMAPMSQADAMQAMYGDGGMQGGPMSMQGGPGCGPGGCGPGGGPCNSCDNSCEPNQAQCFEDGGHHSVYGSIELFYARRNVDLKTPQGLVIDSNSGNSVGGTDDFDFLYKPGVKTTVGYWLPNGWGIEGTYWGQLDWRTNHTVNGDNNLSLPGDLPLSTFDFFDADQIGTSYSTRINNAELNLILPYASVQFLGGFRYIQLDDRLDIHGFDADTDPAGGGSDYIVSARNRLYGGQLGARTQLQVWAIGFDFEMKAGVFADAAHQGQSVSDLNNSVVLRDSGSADKTNVAFVGEVGAYALIPMGSYFTGKFGYTATWIEDIGLAPDQLDFSNTATSGTGLNTHGQMLIHGFIAGIEAHW